MIIECTVNSRRRTNTATCACALDSILLEFKVWIIYLDKALSLMQINPNITTLIEYTESVGMRTPLMHMDAYNHIKTNYHEFGTKTHKGNLSTT